MEDELTLMDVFKVLARRWKLIVAVTLIPTMVAAGVLLLAVKPTFTSTAIVMVSDTTVTVTLQNLGQLADPVVTLPTATVVAYQNLARDPSLSQEVINKAGLAGEPWNMTVRKLASAVKISSVSGSGLIQIEVTLGDSNKAALAANALAEGLVARGESISKTPMPAAQQGLKESYDAAKSALQAVEQQLAALNSKRDSVTELTNVRDTILGQLNGYPGQAVLGQPNGYRAQVQTLATDIRALQLNLATKQSALAGSHQYLTTTKSITDDQTLLDVAKATSGQSVLDLARLNMTSQEINPVWQSLTSDVTDLKTDIAYKTSLKALYEKTIPGLESRVLDLNQRIDAENKIITSTQRSKDLLDAKFSLATTNYVSSLKYVEGNPLPPVRLVQRAIPADEKDAGGRSTKVAVTLVAALFLSILLAFLIDYIQTARAAEAEARRAKES
ncbi:MAG: Wzz/FepE/Etk N-terminal domain-containing protein [Caldisericia bacterium]